MQKIKSFGFKTIQVNGAIVFTCNISVNRIPTPNLPKIEGMNIWQTDKPMGKNKIIKETTNFCYTTMSYSDHSRMQKELGLFLEQLAINKIKAKFQWAHPEEIDFAFYHNQALSEDLDF